MKPTPTIQEAETASDSPSTQPLAPNSPHPRKPSRPAKNKKWSPSGRFPWRISLVLLTLPLALLPIVLLAAAAEVASQSYLAGRTCYPNGRWKEASGASWRIMDSSYFFTPNLAFGAMTFTQVKVVDITWDLLVGRGGQMLLAYANYRVFNEWLVWQMERWRTRWRMVVSVAFQTTTVGTLGVLGREWLCYGERSWARWWRWIAVLGMVLGTTYVLSWPTLMAAMTGYITTFEPYVEDGNGNLVAWREIGVVEYVVQDGWRLDQGYAVPLVSLRGDDELARAIANYSRYYMGGRYDPFSRTLKIPYRQFTSIQRDLPSTFVFNGTTTHLPSPTLNITFAPPVLPEANRPSPGLIYPWYSLSASRQSPMVPASYVYTHSSCKPSDTYQWGFSYIFLFMMAIFNFVWTCIVVGMWLDTRLNSRMYRSGRRPGLLRSILDVADAMREELGRGEEVDSAREEELEKMLNESGATLVVDREELKVVRVGGAEREMIKMGWRRRLTKGSTF
ncbi:hypothetical protein BU23DRAFT_592442 [Bimuria novae-zelandiae CBS 107.79]|uniref:Uncharacterized protein n=1 Tax=Bimuria novae-zelandiae CBS 107.79 TaxID=1447943 RepID=A0A6A5UU37_9PLEO|nr:hypothetical protein BU23DRAFT_592442 [Bimuria novae-zelandiae CBS 107.79]